MSGLMRLIDRLLAEASNERADWARAALAELTAIEGGRERAGWLLGIFGMLAGDALGRVLWPWARAEGEPVPFAAAAGLGGMLLLPAGGFVLAARLAPAALPQALGLLLLGLAAWSNVGVLFKGQHLGGLLYAVGLRVKVLNLAVLAAAAALAFQLTVRPF